MIRLGILFFFLLNFTQADQIAQAAEVKEKYREGCPGPDCPAWEGSAGDQAEQQGYSTGGTRAGAGGASKERKEKLEKLDAIKEEEKELRKEKKELKEEIKNLEKRGAGNSYY